MISLMSSKPTSNFFKETYLSHTKTAESQQLTGNHKNRESHNFYVRCQPKEVNKIKNNRERKKHMEPTTTRPCLCECLKPNLAPHRAGQSILRMGGKGICKKPLIINSQL
ncbi:hypothetical protein CEXT_588891 [Caerostris extrusa]|uniref:Uncharacterized protein n=1 Tax=Caerostris extrusa TaxID=172846 RepID=A0AAV4TPL6_CAEEX|nr:hypothetical protein CEXT_588891 [Caerostris extrusa]